MGATENNMSEARWHSYLTQWLTRNASAACHIEPGDRDCIRALVRAPPPVEGQRGGAGRRPKQPFATEARWHQAPKMEAEAAPT
eukprot:8368721-Pyramimonas_sp.AAC.1